MSKRKRSKRHEPQVNKSGENVVPFVPFNKTDIRRVVVVDTENLNNIKRVNRRLDAIELLHARGTIDAIQYMAAHTLKALFEKKQISAPRSLDPSRPVVDCSVKDDSVPRAAEAEIKYSAAMHEVSIKDKAICEQVVCKGFSIQKAVGDGSRARANAAKSLRFGLDALSEHFGYRRKCS